MELLRDSDEWADVEPLPQDDGPDPVVPIAYSREFDDAMGFMRAVLASGERSARVLRLTERVISVNAASYTAWQLRRDVLAHLLSLAEPVAMSSKPSSTSADENRADEGDWLVQDEVLYAENVTLSNPKNYQVWHHRRWLAALRKHRVTRREEQMEQQQQQQEQECASSSPSPLQQVSLRSIAEVALEEFRFCEEALLGDSKNYHAWCHRQWVAREFDTWHGELAFCERLLDDDVRNNSAWNHRMFVLEHLIAKQKQGAEQVGGGANQEKGSEIRVTPVTVEDEVAFAVTAIWLAPSNESPWRYLQGLIRLQEKETAGVGKEGDLKLLGICVDVLASEPECVHALATLLSAWTDLYGLAAGSVLPPSRIALPPNVPPAPHLEDCAARTAERLKTEMRGPNGEPPRWTRARGGCWYPQPPWVGVGGRGKERGSIASLLPSPLLPLSLSQVRGSDAANLAATRQAQADIWRHQFPNQSPSAATSAAATSSAATSAAAGSPSQSESNPVSSTSACSGRRLFVVDWPKRKHGIGSQLSIMSAYLSLALTHNRTLVPTPGTYLRANHSECLEAGNLNSFDCYFFPLVARSCEERVREVMRGGGEAERGVGSGGQKTGEGEGEGAAGKLDGADGEEGREWKGACADHSNVRALLGSDRPIVRFCGNYLHLKYEAGAARLWGSAYLRRRNSIEVRGRVKASVPRLQQVHWWRAQSLRFMLRWPSAYLCHVSNRVRQQAYGLHVAVRIEEARAAQKKILNSLGAAAATGAGDAAADAAAVGVDGGDAAAADANAVDDDNNEDGVKVGNEKEGEEGEDEEEVYRRVGREVYMPRPGVSVHVRQGDKQKEMKLSSFRAYMLHVQRLRLRVPDVHYVWLSTEMQSIIDELGSYSDWTFLYSKNRPQLGSTQMLEYEIAAGLEQLVGVSFANRLSSTPSDAPSLCPSLFLLFPSLCYPSHSSHHPYSR
ncbi:unnamed protein product [Closterium sp. Naga37s-1]|nr:unnamed protein product [Closterium sp. Naga37s-1]